MAQINTIVSPVVDSTGVSVGIIPYLISDIPLEKASINTGSCIIVETERSENRSIEELLADSDLLNKSIELDSVNYTRLELGVETPTSIKDYGDVSPRELYRTKVSFIPKGILKPNTHYVCLVSSRTSILSTFDPKGTLEGRIFAEGVYSGQSEENYTVEILIAGAENEAIYNVTRQSDNKVFGPFKTSSRLTEIDNGFSLKFRGSYLIGETCTIKVLPKDLIGSVVAWGFSTGSGAIQTPEDKLSGSIIGLPVAGGVESANSDSFSIVSINPEYASSLNPIGRVGSTLLGGIQVITKERTDAYNGYILNVLYDANLGEESVQDLDGSALIHINAATQLAVIQVLINTSFLSSFLTANLVGTAIPSIGSYTIIDGEEQTKIVITFNKDIDETSIQNKIGIYSQRIYPSSLEKKENYSIEVSGKTLTISFI